MSHIVQIQTKMYDQAAVVAACLRLGLAEPIQGTARLYSGEARGLLVQLPGWRYPVVIDTATGTTKFDNYQEAWGEQRQFDGFVQMYSVEKTKLEGRKKGYSVSEQILEDGSILLKIHESV